MVDFADLAIRTDYSSVDKATAALDRLTAAGQRAEQSANRIGVSSIAQTRNMGAWAAIQAEAAGHVGEHSIAIGRLERALASVVGHFFGANSAVESLVAGLLKFSVGTLETVGVLAGLAAIVGFYELITADARAATKQVDDMTDALVKQARAAREATVAGRDDLKLIAETNQLTVRKESGFGWRSMLTSVLTGRPAIDATDAENQSTRLANVQTGVERATDNYTDAWKKAEDDRTRKSEEEERKRLAAANKATEEAIRYREMMEAAYGGRLGIAPMTSAQRADWTRGQASLGMGDSERSALNKQLGFEYQAPKFSMPNVQIGDSLTDLQKSLEKLIISAILAAEAHKKFVDELVNARAKLAYVKEQFRGGNILSGAQAGAESGVADALSQFTPQALTYKAVTSGLNFIAQGFMDMASSMLDGGAAAREYARALRQQTDEYAAAIAQFKHDDLAATLAQNSASAEQLIKQMEDLYGNVSAIIKAFQTGTLVNPQTRIDDIKAQEAKNAEIIKRNAGYALEDLAVRNERALGQGDAAGLLAFKEGQQREMQAAIDANRDATYLNTLQTTLNNELIAYQNGLLSTALRNAPPGFYGAAAYIGQYATPRSADPFGTGMPAPNSPINPTGGLTPPGGSGGRPVPRDLTVNVMLPDGRVLTRAVVKDLDQTASASNGAGSSRSQALDAYN